MITESSLTKFKEKYVAGDYKDILTIVQPSAKIIKLSSSTGAECIKNIEKYARVCYKSEERSDGSLEGAINFLKRTIFAQKDGHIHDSVIEHESATVRFIVDRAVANELVRHRIASYSQESTRYCNYGTDKFGNSISVIDPTDAFGWADDDLKTFIWADGCYNAANFYFTMLKAGCSPQQARSVLPLSTKTEVVATLNFRSWRNFFALRDDNAAHPQMRQVASMLHKEFQKAIPYIFD